MPEKVIHGGRLIPGVAEVEVPSWVEFDSAIFELKQRLDLIRQEFASSNENKQALWDAVNQLKRDPAGDIYSEFRALRDAAFSAQTQINGPQPNGEWTIWQYIGNHGERLDAIDKKFRELPDMVKETLRDGLLSQLQPLLDSAKANIDSLLNDNSNLKNTTSALSDAMRKHGEHLDTLEKQMRELPDKAREVLLGSILAELQPRLDSANADIASLRNADDEREKAIDSLRTEISSCQANLKQEVASSHEASDKLEEEINSLRAGLSTCQRGLKQELASSQEAISNLKKENASLREKLSACQSDLDALLHPPKKQGFFQRQYFRMVKFFRRKAPSDTTTPPPQGSQPCP